MKSDMQKKSPSGPDGGEVDQSAANHELLAARYYDDVTTNFYVAFWHSEHIHWGLFKSGEYPTLRKKAKPSSWRDGRANLTRGLERMIEAVVTPAGITKDHHVVDAGCGLGGTALYLARTRGCEVTGVNVSNVQLEIARQKAKDAGLESRVGFKYGNCSVHLPFDDASVDVVVNLESACHYSDRAQFLHEIHRILRPGGRIAASDWLVSAGTSAEQYEKYIQPICHHWVIPGLESLSSYQEKLRDAELTVLECKGFEGGDIGNPRLLENYCRIMKGLKFCHLLPAKLQSLMPGIEAIITAWELGHYEVGRYCAAKPGGV